eukprot:tig00020629_g12371.t1
MAAEPNARVRRRGSILSSSDPPEEVLATHIGLKADPNIDRTSDKYAMPVNENSKDALQQQDKGGKKKEVDLEEPGIVRKHLEHEFRFMRLNLKRARLFNLTYTR